MVSPDPPHRRELADDVTPYYDDGGITIFHGDCREILPAFYLTGTADAVVTDPPYGIGFEYATHDDNREAWFDLMDEVVPLMRQCAPFVAMPSCGIDRLGWWYEHHPPTWIVAWYKGSPGHLSKIGFNDWESHLVWGRPWKQMHDYFMAKSGFEDDLHPCPKPIQWAQWWVSRAAPRGGLIVDPFAGSGTTLVAAKMLGRRAIGIEIEESYCAMAVERLRQDVLPLDVVPLDSDEQLEWADSG
jgi:site-specific DNA-methyltransferase (adenine-specific)